MNNSFQDFLQTSFNILRSEQSSAFSFMMNTLKDLQLYLTVDEEFLNIHFNGSEPSMKSIERKSVLSEDSKVSEIEISKETIVDLIDGELTFLEAVMDGKIFFKGSSESLMQLSEGLQWYLKGGIRCRGFPKLLTDFRESMFSAYRDENVLRD